MNDKLSTFRLMLPNDEIILLPPNFTTTISDVYRHVNIYTKDDLILYYKNVPIPKNGKINLINIGYDPYELLYMKPNEVRECSFEISKYKYSYSKQFQSYQTIFDIKTFFAKEFHTIAQNIVVKNNSQILQDNSSAIDNNNYEIDVIEGYSLFYVFLFKFFFICLPNNSTFDDLKFAISGYYNLLPTNIIFGPNLDKLMSSVPYSKDNLIQEYSSKIAVFDFKYENPQTNNNNIEISIESPKNHFLFQFYGPYFIYKSQPSSIIRTIKFSLEKKTHINNDNFIHVADSHKKCSFYSSNKLYVTIEYSKKVFPYLITIKELKDIFCPKDNEVGFIINNRFVFEESDFLAKYLGSPNSEESPMHIILIKPNTNCRLCQIESGKCMKIHSFIIPTFYTFNQITTVYYGKKPNSLQFFSGFYIGNISLNSPLDNTSQLSQINSNQFWVILTKEITINYYLYSDKKEYSINLNNEQPLQIKDLLFEISKEQNKQNLIYDAYVKEKRVDFWEDVIEFIDQVLEIKTYEYPYEYIKIFDVATNILIKYRITDSNVTAEQIINDLFETETEHNFSLYLNFHKLSPTDKPILLYQPYDFLFLNKNIPEQKFSISNEKGIDITKSISFETNHIISKFIISLFGIKSDVEFCLKISNSCIIAQKEFSLPSGFDSGCFPKDSIIIVNYKTLGTTKLIFEYEKSKKDKIMDNITLNDPNKPIRTLKKEIFDKMKIFNLSPNVASFEFNGITLNQNKTFSSYGITENSIIKIVQNINKIRIEIRLFNEIKLGDYFFSSRSTVKDIIDLLKLEYEVDDSDYRLNIYSKSDQNTLLCEEQILENDEILYTSFEKVKIRLLDPTGQRIEFDEILKPTKKLIMTEILPNIPEVKRPPSDTLVLYSRQNNGHYVAVDETKTFKDIGNTQYFLFKKLTNITFYFNGNEIKLPNELKISEFESVDSIINNYLKNVLLAPPQSIKLTVNNIELNSKMLIKDYISDEKKINIKLDDLISDKSIKKISKCKIKLSSFKPKISKEENKQENRKVKDEDQEKNEIITKNSENNKKTNDDDETINEKCKDEEIKDTTNNAERNDEYQEISANKDKNESLFIGEEEEKYHEIIEKIGEGATSFTYKIIDKQTNLIMCKKVIKINEKNAFKLVKNAFKEFDVMRLIDHPCICRVIGINFAEKIKNDMNEEITTIALFLEYLDHKLDEYLNHNQQNYTMKTKIIVEIVHGMSCLHKNHIIHRDLKIDNIMLDSNCNAKVVDFGLVQINESFSKSEMSFVGTESFMSPEMANEDEYNEKTDVYSFGIVLYYIFIGNLPRQKKKDKLNGIPLPLPEPSDSISQVCLELISKCLSYDKNDRPSFDEILLFLRNNSYSLASNIDEKFIEKRDYEIEHFDQKLFSTEEKVDEFTYTFHIKGKDNFRISFNKDATIKNAIKIIAEREKVNIHDISISFKGKEIQKTRNIAQMKLKKEDILEVFISYKTSLIKTAQDLKIIPLDQNSDDSEYEYVYEDEEEEEDNDE